MGVVEEARANVEACLANLENVYSFAVDQRTFAVSQVKYQRAREDARKGLLDVYAKIHNGNGEVLHVRRDGDPELPGTTVKHGESLEPALESAVRERTGAACSIDGIERATILGVRNRDDPDRPTVYRLSVVFDAVPDSGFGGGNVTWRELRETARPGHA